MATHWGIKQYADGSCHPGTGSEVALKGSNGALYWSIGEIIMREASKTTEG
ncbi:MAG: hypothetical protein HKM04_05555 [Legionellales bacterium]|nr:hypothetical protein [Legionellales bacterium]